MADQTPISDGEQQDRVPVVDVSDISLGDFHITSRTRQELLTRGWRKESNAHRIALIIVITFCLSLLCVFGSFGFVLYGVVGNGSSTVTDLGTVYDMLKDSLSTIGTLFGPLLAFILGYYFNESRNRRESS